MAYRNIEELRRNFYNRSPILVMEYYKPYYQTLIRADGTRTSCGWYDKASAEKWCLERGWRFVDCSNNPNGWKEQMRLTEVAA